MGGKRMGKKDVCVSERELHNQTVWKPRGGQVWTVLISTAPAPIFNMFYGGFSTLSLWEIESWSSTRGNEASYQALGRSSISSSPSITLLPTTHLWREQLASHRVLLQECEQSAVEHTRHRWHTPSATFPFNSFLCRLPSHSCHSHFDSLRSSGVKFTFSLLSAYVPFPFQGSIWETRDESITLQKCSLFLPLQPRL